MTDDLDEKDTAVESPAKVTGRPGRAKDGPGDIPQPSVMIAKLRKTAQAMEDRDRGVVGGVKRKPTHTPLQFAVPEDSVDAVPGQAKDEVTDVHKLIARVMAGEDFTAPQIRLTEAIVRTVWDHVNSAERRRGTGDLAVLAAHGGPDMGARLDAVEDGITEVHSELDDLRGLRPARSNGKVGTLRGEIKVLRAVLIALAMAVLGGVGVAARALYTAGESRGAEAAEFERVRVTVESLSVQVTAHTVDLVLIKNGILPAKSGLPGAGIP